jgi:predicted nucleic acid-binding protein
VLVDTNIVIDRLRGSEHAKAFINALARPPAISVLTITELVAGARTQKEELTFFEIVSVLRVLPETEKIASRAGEWLRHYSGSQGLDFPDAIIAATEQHSLPLVTMNLKHFPMFPKLKRPY